MGFLAPLYALGLLAISLPIIFHLLRRSPHGKQVFSSLMFLEQSPPRLTRKSRLSNILLLILRALAFTLLAIAFARPFFEWGSNIEKLPTSGRRMAIMLDTSASMRRGDLWRQALARADDTLKNVSPADEVALYTFDTQIRPLFTFEEWNDTPPGNRVSLLKAQLAKAEPGWQATRLGDSLAAMADIVGETGTGGGARARELLERQIVLISDMQQGSRPEALQGHQWPENVKPRLLSVAAAQTSNASVQWVKQETQGAAEPTAEMAKKDAPLRVRISNEPNSTKENFNLTWSTDKGPVKDFDPLKVYVPPGHSEIVKVEWPKDTITGAPLPVDRLVLSGDDADFDNTLYLVSPRPENVKILVVGPDKPEDVNGLLYYLRNALADTGLRKIDWVIRSTNELFDDSDLRDVRLVVVSAGLPSDAINRLDGYLKNGGQLLWIMRDTAAARGVDVLGAGGGWQIDEVTGDFALLGRVDLQHPLFAPFAEARFSDFTKIHFWKHRRVTGTGDDVRILAAFDNGDPFLLERTIGKGTLRVMTSGWQPADSQLALSTKFVPLMEGMLGHGPGGALVGEQCAVGESIHFPATSGNAGRTMLTPDGNRAPIASGAAAFNTVDKPGIYKLLGADSTTASKEEALFAVNLSPEESRTAPLPEGELRRYGIPDKAPEGSKEATEQANRQRRLKLAELENRQKLWRWLIVGVLGLLAAETLLAGRLARRAPPGPVAKG